MDIGIIYIGLIEENVAFCNIDYKGRIFSDFYVHKDPQSGPGYYVFGRDKNGVICLCAHPSIKPRKYRYYNVPKQRGFRRHGDALKVASDLNQRFKTGQSYLGSLGEKEGLPFTAQILEEYGGYIIASIDGVIAVIGKTDKPDDRPTVYFVSLDDSKCPGNRRMVYCDNEIGIARKYIEWLHEVQERRLASSA